MSSRAEAIAEQISAALPIMKIWGNLIYNVKDVPYGAKGDGLNDDSSAFVKAITAAVNGGIVMIPPGTYRTTSFTVPSNVTLWIANGAKLSVDSGSTVTINGDIDAGHYEIFSGSGSVVGNPKVDFISPCWFGARDDESDIVPAMHKAIAFLPTAGGVIQFPTGGWWYVKQTINIDRAAVTIRGQGNGNATNLVVTSHEFDILNITAYDCTLENFDISATDPGITGKYAIVCASGRHRVRSIGIYGTYHGFLITGGANSGFHDVKISSIKAIVGVGITLDTTNEVMEFDNIVFENAGEQDAYAGFLIKGGSGIQIADCDIQKMGRAMAIAPTDRNVFSVNVSNTFFDTSTINGLVLSPGVGQSVIRSRFSSCWFSSSKAVGGRGIEISGNCQGIILEACEVYDNASDGIRVRTGSSVKSMIINACQIAGNGGAGIAIEAGVSDFSITNCTIGATATFGVNNRGIEVDVGASDHYVIANNTVYGNTAGQIADGGTGVNKVVANNITA